MNFTIAVKVCKGEIWFEICNYEVLTAEVFHMPDIFISKKRENFQGSLNTSEWKQNQSLFLAQFQIHSETL